MALVLNGVNQAASIAFSGITQNSQAWAAFAWVKRSEISGTSFAFGACRNTGFRRSNGVLIRDVSGSIVATGETYTGSSSYGTDIAFGADEWIPVYWSCTDPASSGTVTHTLRVGNVTQSNGMTKDVSSTHWSVGGAFVQGNMDLFFKGKIAHFAFWYGSLPTSDEIDSLIAGTAPSDLVTTAPNGYYPLIDDLGGLTGHGSPTFDEDDPLVDAPAGPVVLTEWTRLLETTTNMSANCTMPTISAGSNRLVLIAIRAKSGSGAVSVPASITCNGVTAHREAGDSVTRNRVALGLYVFREADIATISGQTLISIAEGTNSPAKSIHYKLLGNCDQGALAAVGNDFNDDGGSSAGNLSISLARLEGSWTEALSSSEGGFALTLTNPSKDGEMYGTGTSDVINYGSAENETAGTSAFTSTRFYRATALAVNIAAASSTLEIDPTGTTTSAAPGAACTAVIKNRGSLTATNVAIYDPVSGISTAQTGVSLDTETDTVSYTMTRGELPYGDGYELQITLSDNSVLTTTVEMTIESGRQVVVLSDPLEEGEGSALENYEGDPPAAGMQLAGPLLSVKGADVILYADSSIEFVWPGETEPPESDSVELELWDGEQWRSFTYTVFTVPLVGATPAPFTLSRIIPRFIGGVWSFFSRDPLGEEGDQIPSAPTDLGSIPGSTSVIFTWTLVPHATSIALYLRNDTAEGEFVLVTDEIAGNATNYEHTGVTPETEYSWYITATSPAGTSEPSDIADFTTEAELEGLIWSEDFEGTLKDSTELINGAAVVTTSVLGGTKACRINLKDGVTDPISGNVGDNAQTVGYLGTELRDSGAEKFTIMWDVMFDDCWWKGTGFANSSGETTKAINLKGGYFGPYPEPAGTGFFPVLDGGPNGSINWGSNHSTAWVNEPWVNDPGRLLWYLETGQPFGSDGIPHEFKITIDGTVSNDYWVVQMWMDGHLATNANYAADGKLRMPKTWSPECFTTTYTSPQIVDTSVDGDGYACGVYIKNIRIYHGEGPA